MATASPKAAKMRRMPWTDIRKSSDKNPNNAFFIATLLERLCLFAGGGVASFTGIVSVEALLFQKILWE
jgi:hypothetical protein